MRGLPSFRSPWVPRWPPGSPTEVGFDTKGERERPGVSAIVTLFLSYILFSFISHYLSFFFQWESECIKNKACKKIDGHPIELAIISSFPCD